MTQPAANEAAARRQKVAHDPRFRRAAKKESRLQVDRRFQHMFTDASFVRPYSVDKYGRTVAKDSKKAARRELERFYRLDREQPAPDASSSESEAQASSDSDSGSGTDSDAPDATLDDAFSQHPLVSTDVAFGDATSRLAVVNLDWDQIKAVDLFVLFHGFKPALGRILSVKIYPSEFGKERMGREAVEGPPRAIFKAAPAASTGPTSGSDSDSDVDVLADLKANLVEEAGDFDQGALRRYQLERLRYFYAVVECDSVGTALAIYNHCDGREFESSTNTFDLRYVPDGVLFADAELHDSATALPPRYHPKFAISTDALQQSSVKLSWDQDDPDRKRLTRATPGAIDYDEADLLAYLATDESDSEPELVVPRATTAAKDDKIAKYRALLLSGKDENVFGRRSHADNDELSITFTPGISADAAAESASESQSEELGERVAQFDAAGNLIGAMDAQPAPTTAKAKAKKEQPVFQVTREWKKTSGPKKTRKAAKHVEDDEDASALADFKVNVADPRFAAVYDQPAFAIDPTASNFKSSAGLQAIIAERQKRKYSTPLDEGKETRRKRI